MEKMKKFKKNLNFVFVALRKKIHILQQEKRKTFHVDFMLKILKVKFKG